MRISDWSSDVCSSDLEGRHAGLRPDAAALYEVHGARGDVIDAADDLDLPGGDELRDDRLRHLQPFDVLANVLGGRLGEQVSRLPGDRGLDGRLQGGAPARSEESTSELQSLMRHS